MPRGELELIPIYVAERRDLIRRLASRLEHEFGLTVSVRHPGFDPEIAFDRSRGQYNSTRMLELLLAGRKPPGMRVLGVTAVDLFVPVLSWVFGEAQLGGRAAVVSMHRLRPEAYGLPDDEELLFRRLLTESVHELGHTWGLLHCRERSCAMHASTYAEEIDLKSCELCPACREAAEGEPAVRAAGSL